MRPPISSTTAAAQAPSSAVSAAPSSGPGRPATCGADFLAKLSVREKIGQLLMVGVNGTGKTTTTGKLARVLEAYAKRLQVQDADHFEMISDNKKHKDRAIRMDETYIHARVLLVWNAHLV